MTNNRDIDAVIERLRTELSGVQVRQLTVSHPADDDGIWIVSIPGYENAVQIESSSGDCPFLIESEFSDERFCGQTVDETVTTVKRLCPPG